MMISDIFIYITMYLYYLKFSYCAKTSTGYNQVPQIYYTSIHSSAFLYISFKNKENQKEVFLAFL